uniref:Uncharacterized protein n=1 Tax=viral metagenome TaxID=1070528 RepID=A0A6C0HCL8_9ZZZZ
MEKTTRISDLPENITMQMPAYGANMNQNGGGGGSNKQNMNFESPTNYTPINIHPNPYGISAQNPIMPPPQQPNVQQMQQMNQMEYSAQPPARQYLSEQQQMEIQNMQQMRLPSRDIPLDTTNYQNDEEIQANYIPKPKITKDYLKDYEETSEKRIREHEEKKYRENKLDTILTDIQTPILIAFLFFFFQLPIINTFIFKRFSFMNLYNEDGNFNFSGLVFKSIFFGSVFYSIQKAMTFISEF